MLALGSLAPHGMRALDPPFLRVLRHAVTLSHDKMQLTESESTSSLGNRLTS